MRQIGLAARHRKGNLMSRFGVISLAVAAVVFTAFASTDAMAFRGGGARVGGFHGGGAAWHGGGYRGVAYRGGYWRPGVGAAAVGVGAAAAGAAAASSYYGGCGYYPNPPC